MADDFPIDLIDIAVIPFSEFSFEFIQFIIHFDAVHASEGIIVSMKPNHLLFLIHGTQMLFTFVNSEVFSIYSGEFLAGFYIQLFFFAPEVEFNCRV